MNEALLEACIAGAAINLIGTAVALYLWTQQKSERYLLFWTLAWAAGTLRWVIHGWAETDAAVRAAEGLLIQVILFFMVLGSYDLLPARPWRRAQVVWGTAGILLAYGLAAHRLGLPIEMGYALFAAVLLFCALCMARAFRAARLSGYAFAAAAFLFQFLVVTGGLFLFGSAVANSLIAPMIYNAALIVSLVMIAYQRNRRELVRSDTELRASATQLQALYLRLGTAEEDERRALHGELHDKVGANLSALRLELDLAGTHLSRGNRRDVEHHLESARQVTTETIAMTRDLMAELRPPALDDYGLLAGLRVFAESQALRLDMNIEVMGSGLTTRPGTYVERTLFRIAREALINAAKHAAATHVVIAVEEHDGRATVAVEDDGTGFSAPAPGTASTTWGLRSMQERARSIGATLRIDSALGAGTRVLVEVPRSAA